MRRRDWAAAFAIAIPFAAWSLRSIGPYSVVQTDAARHAMNGVFLHDLIERGKFTDALAYARMYFAHLPALSMPYHPPLFPGIEAIFFFLFGVHVFAARIAVALTLAVSALLLFRVAKASYGSTLTAGVTCISFLLLPQSIWLGQDVMLEFPTLVFTLAAICCLQPVDKEYTIRRSLAFAVLAGAAMWTRQQAVFLGTVPFLYFAFNRRWRLFMKPAIWVSTALFGGIGMALTLLSVPFHGAGLNQAVPSVADHIYLRYLRLAWRNLTYYMGNYREGVGYIGLFLLAATIAAFALRCFTRRQWAFYLSWILPSFGILLVLRPFATRYLFLTYPALFALGFIGLSEIVKRLTGKPGWAAAAVTLVGVAGFFVNMPYRTFFLHGPDEAARRLAAVHPKRILYCGDTDGNFILAYRELQKGLDTTVLAGDKLPARVFTPEGMDKFAHDYGVQYIVIENTSGPGRKRPWMLLNESHSPLMVPEANIKVTSSTERWNGNLMIYRFTNPSPAPKDVLSMRMWMIGVTIDFNLDK